MPDDQLADSSPAPSSPLSPSDALAAASPEALATWRNTGELPTEPTPSPAADSTPAEAEAPAETAAPAADDKAAAPSPAIRPKTENAETRKAQLAAEIQELLQRRAQLRRELEQPPPPPQTRADAKPAASSPAPDPADPEPNPDDATKYPDGVYDRRFMKDQANWEARQVFRAEQEAAYTRHREYQAQQAAQERLRGWAERLDAAKAKYPDDWQQRLASVAIPEGSPIDVWVMDSPLGAELLLGPLTNPAEVRRISALPVIQQVRELALLEKSLEPAPAKTITDAPDPPHTLGERTTTPGDPVQRAVKTGDVAAFLAAENAREMALRRASHQ